jgi:hypothetical protein
MLSATFKQKIPHRKRDQANANAVSDALVYLDIKTLYSFCGKKSKNKKPEPRRARLT